MGAQTGSEISSVKKKKNLQQFFLKGRTFLPPQLLLCCLFVVGEWGVPGREAGMSEEYQECTPRICVPIMISQVHPSQKIVLFIIQGLKYKARKHCSYS